MEGSSALICGISKPRLMNGDKCIFCMRKVCTNKKEIWTSRILTSSIAFGDSPCDLLLVVPKAVVGPNFLSILNLVWPYIQSKEEEGSGGSISFEEIIRENRKYSGDFSGEGKTTFSSLPTLCQLCADKVQQVDIFLEGVRSQMKVLRNLLKDSRKGGEYSWRECGRDWISWTREEKTTIHTNISKRTKILTKVPGSQLNLEGDYNYMYPSDHLGGASPDSDSTSVISEGLIDSEIHMLEYDANPTSPKSSGTVEILSDEDESNNGIRIYDAHTPDYVDSENHDEGRTNQSTEGQSVFGKNFHLDSRVVTEPTQSNNLVDLKRKAVALENVVECPVPGCCEKDKVREDSTAHRRKENPAGPAIFRCFCGAAFTSKNRQLHHLRTSRRHAEDGV